MKKILTTISMIIVLVLSICSVNTKLDKFYAENGLDVDCKSAILVDYYSGDVLYSKDCDAKMQVASIVKLMTSLITIEKLESKQLNLLDKVITTENASSMGGSQIFLDPYEEYTIEDLLKGVIVASANDAAVALAEHISGSEKEFVKLMNAKANEIGMKNTLYANSTGLPEPEQYSTARDCSIILKELFKYNTYFKYSQIWMDELTHPSGRKTELVNTNKLIRYFKGCDIGKTGFTDEAGYCLVASAQKDNMRFISCCLGASEKQKRFNEVAKMLNYGLTNFENTSLVLKNNVLKNIIVKGSNITNVDLFAENDYFVLKKKGEELKYEINFDIPEFIKAPLKRGDVVGKILVTQNGNILKEINVVINQDVDKLTYKQSIDKIISKW